MPYNHYNDNSLSELSKDKQPLQNQCIGNETCIASLAPHESNNLNSKVCCTSKKDFDRISRKLLKVNVSGGASKPRKKIKNIYIQRLTAKRPKHNKKKPAVDACNVVVSLRNEKFFKNSSLRRSSLIKAKLFEKNGIHKSFNNQCYLEKRTETSKKGKRGRLGGKAKGVAPKEDVTKCDSDEEKDFLYFYRISLGHFQQNMYKNEASTSKQRDDFNEPSTVHCQQDLNHTMPEDLELLELQNWGMSYPVFRRTEQKDFEKRNEQTALPSSNECDDTTKSFYS